MTVTGERSGRRRIASSLVIVVLLIAGAAAFSWNIGYLAGERDAMEMGCASRVTHLHLVRRQLEREEEYDEVIDTIHREMWAQLKCLELYADENRSDESVIRVRDSTREYLSELYGDQPPP